MRAMTEDEIKVQKMYSNEDHDLKFVLDFASNKRKRKAFVDPSEQILIRKIFKSLDFYDVHKIICAVIGDKPISNVDLIYKPNPIEKIEFSVESAANFTFQKIDENENLNEIQMGKNEKLNEKISILEKRLNELEIRMDKFEKKLLNR